MQRISYYSKNDISNALELYKPYLDIFKNEGFKTISDWDGVDFLKHNTDNITNVSNYLKTFIEDKEDSDIKRIIEYIIEYYGLFEEIIKLGLEGKRSQAYSNLTKNILENLGLPFMTFSEFTNYHFNRAETDFVYRMRVDNDNVFNSTFTGKDLFHVPFEKRHLIGNNRFSLSGLPCLYFANNVYCCWKEMNRPKIEDCFISKFNLTGHSFIDLSVSPKMVDKEINKLFEYFKTLDDSSEQAIKTIEYYITDYLKIWPIIFCCSIRTFYKYSVFKPEYIFPQLMLEWIITDHWAKFDGIKFLSTKDCLLIDKFTSKEVKLINYVIPTRVITNLGFCKENMQKITYTEPVNFQIESMLKNEITIKKFENEYDNSVFGNIEAILNEKEFKRFTD